MASLLFRTGSGSICSSPRFPVPIRHDSFSALSHLEVKNIQKLSRAVSEPMKFARLTSINAGSKIMHEMLREVDEDQCFEPISGVFGGGGGSGRDCDGFGSGRFGGSRDNDDRNKIGARYLKLLESNPNDALVLRNYGKFLHEVEGDTDKAEEYYGRAILASPGDGELLSLYGKLTWDVYRDGERAQYYFDQAISVCPDDCMVMGSYAQFLWEAEEDEEDNTEESGPMVSVRAMQTI